MKTIFEGEGKFKISIENGDRVEDNSTFGNVANPMTEASTRSVVGEMMNDARTGVANQTGRVIVDWTVNNARWVVHTAYSLWKHLENGMK